MSKDVKGADQNYLDYMKKMKHKIFDSMNVPRRELGIDNELKLSQISAIANDCCQYCYVRHGFRLQWSFHKIDFPRIIRIKFSGPNNEIFPWSYDIFDVYPLIAMRRDPYFIDIKREIIRGIDEAFDNCDKHSPREPSSYVANRCPYSGPTPTRPKNKISKESKSIIDNNLQSIAKQKLIDKK